MAVHTHQLAGNFTHGIELIPKDKNIKKIIKLGIQAEEGVCVLLDNKPFEIGKAKVLFFENAEVQSIKLNPSFGTKFLIIDFTYEDSIEE